MEIDEIPLEDIPTCECSCEKCQSACKHRPCWGTPSDLGKIIEAGYADRLMLDYWFTDFNDEDIYILAPAIKDYCKKNAPFFPIGTCNFLKDGLCEIHPIKPLEGKTNSCKPPNYDIHFRLAQTWDTEEGKKLVEKWKSLVALD